MSRITMRIVRWIALLLVLLALARQHTTEAFRCNTSVRNAATNSRQPIRLQIVPGPDHDNLEPNIKDNVNIGSRLSRRQALAISASSALLGLSQGALAADDVYRQARRPTAYLVDSTIPPTLIPLNAPQESRILAALGRGSGTVKDAIVDDRVNLNNILNKAVFGTIDAVSNLLTNKRDESKSGPGYASFVCFGLPQNTQPQDIDLAIGLFTPMLQARKSIKAATALGLAFAPISTQSAFDQYSQTGNETDLREALINAGVSVSTFDLFMPLIALAKSRSLNFLALAPEQSDVQTVRREGLQNIDPDRRAQYVADSEGFIALTQDPKFRLYADRSLLKDFQPMDDKDQPGNFFAERILVHEAAATIVANYAISRPESFVALAAPIPDLRFLGGINGRITRVCQYLNSDNNKVTGDAITTILINPTATETLSLSRFLRLEIGTSPETLPYQTKVADYLWFSTMPKVNMLTRLMNPR